MSEVTPLSEVTPGDGTSLNVIGIIFSKFQATPVGWNPTLKERSVYQIGPRLETR